MLEGENPDNLHLSEEPSTLFDKLKGLVSRFVKPSPTKSQKELHLAGRIQELQSNKDVVHKLLKQIALQVFPDNHLTQEDELHIAAESIAKDLQTVTDYQKHRAEELGIDEHQKEHLKGLLKDRLGKLLNSQLAELAQNIKTDVNQSPKHLPAERIMTIWDQQAWNDKIRLLRQNFFNEALNLVESSISSELTQDENKLLNLHEISDLEEAVPALLEEITKLREMSSGNMLESDLKRFQKRIFFLEDEAEKLESALALTPELAGRLRDMKALLLQAHGLLT